MSRGPNTARIDAESPRPPQRTRLQRRARPAHLAHLVFDGRLLGRLRRGANRHAGSFRGSSSARQGESPEPVAVVDRGSREIPSTGSTLTRSTRPYRARLGPKGLHPTGQVCRAGIQTSPWAVVCGAQRITPRLLLDARRAQPPGILRDRIVAAQGVNRDAALRFHDHRGAARERAYWQPRPDCRPAASWGRSGARQLWPSEVQPSPPGLQRPRLPVSVELLSALNQVSRIIRR